MQLGTGLTLLIGGARSGKSDLSVKLGTAWGGPVTFVATSEPLDDDMADRITKHRLERPAEWPTVEEPQFAADHVCAIPDDDLMILDCVTLLVSNLLFAEAPIAEHISTMAEALAKRSGPTIVVSNEVGMGVHPETSLGRTYRDELGRANRIIAEASDDALLIVAGRAIPLEPVSGPGPMPGTQRIDRPDNPST